MNSDFLIQSFAVLFFFLSSDNKALIIVLCELQHRSALQAGYCSAA